MSSLLQEESNAVKYILIIYGGFPDNLVKLCKISRELEEEIMKDNLPQTNGRLLLNLIKKDGSRDFHSFHLFMEVLERQKQYEAILRRNYMDKRRRSRKGLAVYWSRASF